MGLNPGGSAGEDLFQGGEVVGLRGRRGARKGKEVKTTWIFSFQSVEIEIQNQSLVP
jgi:hypothetical protein